MRPPLTIQRQPPESMFRLYLYSLRGQAVLVEVSWCKAYLVIPVDGEWVEAKRLEVVEILQLATDTLLHQRREVHQPHLARVERQA